jgi:hypothetical protein
MLTSVAVHFIFCEQNVCAHLLEIIETPTRASGMLKSAVATIYKNTSTSTISVKMVESIDDLK